jgi:L-amino acid N-acyltransferase YncA
VLLAAGRLRVGADQGVGPGGHRDPLLRIMNTIRLAIPADLPRLVEIYNQAIASGIATADTAPFTVETRRGWFDAHLPNAYPIYVYEADNQVVGYLSISPYRDRPALARTAEVSYYVDYGWHGKGIGSALMQFALADCARINKKVLLAVILEWNAASIKLLEKFGFEKWGYLPGVAEFDGRLCGHFYYGKELQGTFQG